jgi:integrase
MIVQEAILRWLAYRAQLVKLGQGAAATLENQSKIARLWIDHIGGIELGELRKSHIDLAAATIAKSRAPVTLQADVALLAQILNWCVDEQLLAARPRLPTISVPSEELEFPSDEAFVWILQHVTPARNAEALEFMLLTGLAPHELERVLPRDYCSERGAVGIGYREDFAIKTPSRRRWVPLNTRAIILWRPPFPTVEALEKAVQRARGPDMPPGAADVTPKMMRKWFASQIAGTDTPEHILQRLLGHAPGSKITRRHYVRSTAADGERAVDSLKLKGKS